MRKFTLFLSLMVAMTTSVLASQTSANEETTLTATIHTPSGVVESLETIILSPSHKVTKITMPAEGLAILDGSGKTAVNVPNIILNRGYIQVAMERPISTAGTYTLTLPEGCIECEDSNCKFLGQTFTFVVDYPFEIERIRNPKEGANVIDVIALEFTKSIKDVKLPAEGLKVLDSEGNVAETITNCNIVDSDSTIISFEFIEETIGEDGKEDKIYHNIKTPGTYTLTIPEGIIESKDGNSYTETLTFTIVKPAPVIEASPASEETISKIENIEINIKNAENVTLNNESVTIYGIYASFGYSGTASITKKDGLYTLLITIKDEATGETIEITEEDDYKVVIPAGFFNIDGVDNEKIELAYTVKKSVPLSILSVTPQQGSTIDSLSTIIIQFNQEVGLTWSDGDSPQCLSQYINLKNENGEDIKLVEVGGVYNDLTRLIYTYAEWDGHNWISKSIKEKGKYTLDLSQLILNHDYNSVAREFKTKGVVLEGTYTWTIGDVEEGIDGIDAEDGEQVIYDLTGRRVYEITEAGIYIVDGGKVLVK